MSARASLSIAPHSGVGGCAPMPRNGQAGRGDDRGARRASEKYTTIEEMVPGRMWRTTMVQSERADAALGLDVGLLLEHQRVAAHAAARRPAR